MLRTAIILLLLASSALAQGKWRLVWSDEFNGNTLDQTKWGFDIGGSGWGNHELESYTSRTESARVAHGKLIITARKEPFTGPDGVAREYTSARLLTAGKFTQKYGRFEARIKVPAGIWPAFWMLGNDIKQVGWPKCGEIDIMENIGREPNVVHGTIHGPGYSGDHGIGAPFKQDKPFAAKFHVYAIEWEPEAIRFYVDKHLYETITPKSLPAGAKWVYDHPFFLLLNAAVGGDWPGAPDPSTRFPQEMQVDYVRVYSR
jgi:beta-glucanase (GH16 family)